MGRTRRGKRILRGPLFSLMVNSSGNMIQPPEDSLPTEISKKVEFADESKIHVLAVDDSFVDRKVIEKLLRTYSYRVTTVDSASRALEVLGVLQEDKTPVVPNAIQINLIITDYCMPGMTGYDLLKRVKECSSLREIPVIIMSSENVPNRIKMCLAEGAEDFLLKPVKIADVKRLESHVRDKKPLITSPCTCSPKDRTGNAFTAEDLPGSNLPSPGSSECFKRKAPSEDPPVDKTSERRSRHNSAS